MHRISFRGERDEQSRLVDRAGAWLAKRTYWQAWALVVSSTLVVAALDFLTYDFELCIATLYVAPIAIACWYFGNREGIAVTIAITIMATMKYPLWHAQPDLLIALYNGIARALAFALIAGIVLSLRRLYERVHYLAHRDRMTGVLNKMAFHEEFEKALKSARQKTASLLLTYIDIDGFKAVNDQHGHEAGDTILLEFTRGVAEQLRGTDRVGRLGGDEFATISTLGPDEDPHSLASVLHRRLTANLSKARVPVTCSMGAIIVPHTCTLDRNHLMQEADRLMYRAKRSGKNAVQVQVAGTSTPSGSQVVHLSPVLARWSSAAKS
jgi:diguanylate cyclase (GGDEF)-like protein